MVRAFQFSKNIYILRSIYGPGQTFFLNKEIYIPEITKKSKCMEASVSSVPTLYVCT